ncbi:MAG: 3-deoxy-7-phosphoheptulonate synthase [Limnochordia bacterium]|jgi:3-deoxy-7-phosphoheptulonate synthase|nr:3-deoxy-7-phosphoheptulonate synthase [Limnochordia bacterium]MDD2628614.1 3-deoxy-7-phosphoheptulonate synthase [Limnochordia bacterium]MDD4519115.1 3-deoxy-7-phosphoheptulonate synthase [Limnochordia bacterium]
MNPDIQSQTSPMKQNRTIPVYVGHTIIGGGRPVIMAGPCAVESKEQMLRIGRAVADAGADVLRGGAYKPRTSISSFQGLGLEGLEYLRDTGGILGLPVITEVISPVDVELVGRFTDILQIGSRNMHNYPLLLEVGRTTKPVLLKRGYAATVEEWLAAADYIAAGGNNQIILCERGIRTFTSQTRNTFDISAICLAKMQSTFPVIADPSHAAGIPELVPHLARAAIAAGADGLLIEVHDRPEEALCDGQQALSPQVFRELVRTVRKMTEV